MIQALPLTTATTSKTEKLIKIQVSLQPQAVLPHRLLQSLLQQLNQLLWLPLLLNLRLLQKLRQHLKPTEGTSKPAASKPSSGTSGRPFSGSSVTKPSSTATPKPAARLHLSPLQQLYRRLNLQQYRRLSRLKKFGLWMFHKPAQEEQGHWEEAGHWKSDWVYQCNQCGTICSTEADMWDHEGDLSSCWSYTMVSGENTGLKTV